ncbi:MAG: GEVED domain-containing protein [Bacteroidota bacterium]
MKAYTNLNSTPFHAIPKFQKHLILPLLFSILCLTNIKADISNHPCDESELFIDPIAICMDFATELDFSGTKAISPFNVNGGSIDSDGSIIDYTQGPTAVCFAFVNVSLDAFGNATITPDMIDAGSYGNSGDLTYTLDQTTFDCSDVGDSIVVILTVEDESGNTNSCWSEINVEDKQGPTAICNAFVNVSLGADGTATITPDVIDAGSFDNCGPLTYELSDSIFDCSNIGDSIVVFLTVTDPSGNTNNCWSQIVIEDKLPPSIACPQDFTIECSQTVDIDPDITGYAIVDDNCDNVGVSYIDQVLPLSGPNFKVLRTWKVVDWNSNLFTECIQVINVLDTTPPSIVCVSNLNAGLGFDGTLTLAAEDFILDATDACDAVTLSVFPNQFDCSDIGNTVVTITATDGNGNTSQCFSNLTVEDKLGPTAVCNAFVNVSLAADGTALITSDIIDAGSFDNCGPLTFELSDSLFDCSNIGDSIVVFMTVTDGSGNTNNCWSQITIEDKLPPSILCPGDITLDCSQAGNLDPELTGYPIIDDNCDNLGVSYEDQILPLDGVEFKVLRKWTVVDWNSNSFADCFQVIKVIDSTPPELVCLSEVTAALDFTGNLTLFPEDFVASATDACDSVSLSLTPNQFDCSDIGENVVQVTATDGKGNTSQCFVNLNVEDKTGPIAVCNAVLNVSLDADGMAIILPDFVDAGSSDECGPVTFELDQSEFDCSNIGDSIIVILTVTDQSGNTNQCWSQIIIEDKLAPTVVCPDDITLECSDAGNLDPELTGIPLVEDNCDQIGLSYEDQILLLEGANYKVLRTWDIIDWNSGSVQECIQIISVFDLTPPIIECIGALSANLDANGNLVLFPEDFDNGTSDECGEFELSIDQSQFDCSDVGNSIITLTATDGNGNVSQCLVELTIFGLDADEDGFSICEGDCNDNDNAIAPGLPEVCGDNLDNNCDGQVDEGCICASFAQSTEFEWIESVSSNGNINSSGNDGGFGDYTAVTFEMFLGPNTIELTPGFAGSSYNEFWAIWIDLNQNGIYENSEQVFNQSSSTIINGILSIPITAALGTTSMRVSMKYNDSPDACEIFPEGEVEDYTVEISEPEYCVSQGQSTQFEWIKRVRLKSINNKSDNDFGYGDYTYLSTTLNPGQNKNIKLKPGFSGSSYLENWRVWVDWNNDGDFDDAGELEVETASTGNITAQITVPVTATAGEKRMRVSMKYGGFPGPCEIFTFGEVEDYTIIVNGSNPLVSNNNSVDFFSSFTQSKLNDLGTSEIREDSNPFEVELFPNPASNYLNLAIHSPSSEKMTLIIYNELGQMVRKMNVAQSIMQIDVTGKEFDNGLCILVLEQGQQVITKRIIITK